MQQKKKQRQPRAALISDRKYAKVPAHWMPKNSPSMSQSKGAVRISYLFSGMTGSHQCRESNPRAKSAAQTVRDKRDEESSNLPDELRQIVLSGLDNAPKVPREISPEGKVLQF